MINVSAECIYLNLQVDHLFIESGCIYSEITRHKGILKLNCECWSSHPFIVVVPVVVISKEIRRKKTRVHFIVWIVIQNLQILLFRAFSWEKACSEKKTVSLSASTPLKRLRAGVQIYQCLQVWKASSVQLSFMFGVTIY